MSVFPDVSNNEDLPELIGRPAWFEWFRMLGITCSRISHGIIVHTESRLNKVLDVLKAVNGKMMNFSPCVAQTFHLNHVSIRMRSYSSVHQTKARPLDNP